MFDEAAQVIETYLNNIGSNRLAHLRLARVYHLQGKVDLALAEIEKAFALDPTFGANFSERADIYFYMGELEKAEEDYRVLLLREEPVVHTWGLVGIASLNQIRGKFEETKATIKEGLKQAESAGQNVWIRNWKKYLAYMELMTDRPERAIEVLDEIYSSAAEDGDMADQFIVLMQKCRVYLELDNINEAQNIADEIKQRAEKAFNKKIIRNYYFSMGLIELKKNNYSRAIEYIQKGFPLLNANSRLHLYFKDFLGLAYYGAGDLENALKTYEEMTSLTVGRIEFGDIYVKSYYMLGKIYEQQDNRTKAIENYDKVLELWKDADPGIAEVEDAQKRLSSLNGQ